MYVFRRPISLESPSTDGFQVADNWEEADDSEAEREKAVKAAAAKAKLEAEAAKNKKSKTQRIEEKREEARRKRAAEEEEEDSDDEDPAEKRARLLRQEKDADLQNAADLLSNVGLGPKTRTIPGKTLVIEDKSNPGQAIDLTSIALFKPSTKTQFDELSCSFSSFIFSLLSAVSPLAAFLISVLGSSAHRLFTKFWSHNE